MNKTKKLGYSLSFLGVLFGTLGNLEAMMGNRSPDDPLIKISYRKAFNQEDKQKKSIRLMRELECNPNIFPDEPIYTPRELRELDQPPCCCFPCCSTQFKDINDNEFHVIDFTKDGKVIFYKHSLKDIPEWKKYKKACLNQLKSARRWAITDQAIDSTTTIALIASFTGGAAWWLGIDSFGGGIMISSSFFSSVHFMRDIIRAFFNLVSTPSHPLDRLEKRFAKTQCFIPRELWPPLIDSFMKARQNPFELQKNMNFIEFTLGLTTYRPIIKRMPRNFNKFFSLFEATISTKMDNFFSQYNKIDDQEYNNLKMNIFKYTWSILNRNEKDEFPRYIYLHGQGGVGKTYFTKQLGNWIDELLGDVVHFEDFVVTTPDELEGSANKPGIFLQLLRNQCLAKKIGSVVLMDEANWINKPDMVSAAKRVFNGELAQLSTTYFGLGIDGNGVKLKRPSMLVILSSNDLISDDALRSRFDEINFPLPTREALNEYGKNLLKRSIFQYMHSDEQEIKFLSSLNVEEVVKDCQSFRDVEKAMPASTYQMLKRTIKEPKDKEKVYQ